MLQNFEYKNIFQLESGETLPGFKLAFQTFGKLNEYKSNVIWVIHALTANSDPSEWWPGIVGENCPIDINEYFVICANSLGSPYGSTNPLSINPQSDEPYYHDFPLITNKDITASFELLRRHLGLEEILLLAGASLGGQQALEWSIQQPDVFKNLLLIATNAVHSPWAIAFNESQRLAIQADKSWNERRPDAGLNGLKAARSIALLSYRTPDGYNRVQADSEEKLERFKVQSYQQYQGEKLVRRFNAFSYYTLTKAMDSHNVGRGRGGLVSALSLIKAKTFIISIASDILFRTQEQKFLRDSISDAQLVVIHSDLGHDGFLTERIKVGNVINRILLNVEKMPIKSIGEITQKVAL
ncbi:MAG: homoserine O-acetyltransferase [Saprospiraceae bacterium]|nr:homoserine O-acetyltransferase [Saprospiraceae bacterium]